MTSPQAGDIMLVAIAQRYSILRATGEGVAAGHHPDDPRHAMFEGLALATGRILAAARRVSVWTLHEDGQLTFVLTYRAKARHAR